MPSGDESAYVAFMDRISHADLTPEELNQPEPWTGINAYRSDPLLVDISSAMPRAVREEFDVIGRYATAHEAQELARMQDWAAASRSARSARAAGSNCMHLDAARRQWSLAVRTCRRSWSVTTVVTSSSARSLM